MQNKQFITNYPIKAQYLPQKLCILCVVIVPIFLFIFSCQKKGQETIKQDNNKKASITTSGIDSIYYAKGFQIETCPDYYLVRIYNPWNTGKILKTYLLAPRSKKLPEHLPEGIVIRTPPEKTVCFSSVVCGIFNELDVLSTLVGVAEPQYIDIPYVKGRLSDGKIQDVGLAANPSIEKLILTEPDVIFSNPINETSLNSLEQLNIPIFSCVEYMENHPLGQTEWIRLIGLLFDRRERADSLFFETVRSYNELKKMTDSVPNCPTVFTELKYGNFWYMPGGKSYLSYMLRDARADYILKDNLATGSIPFSFETVLDKAEKADFWLIKYFSPQELTYKQLAADFANYTLFDAYKKRTVYACNTFTTPYYKELSLHPDWVLKNLIKIFHPELLPNYQPRYYTEIK
jgi:iron complex transport system substrate-binding protein